MTVQYNQDVLTGGPVVFLRLLLRWKGCVMKLIYVDLIVFILAYAVVGCVYRFVLTAGQQKQFESVVLYVFDFQQMIPVSFILGILTQREGDLIDSTDPVAAQPFLPLVWVTAISMRAEKDGYIRNPHALVNLIQVINGFRESLLKLFLMDKVCVPLVYTQVNCHSLVVILAVYSYFLSSVIGRQFIVNTSDYSEPFRRDYYVPLYTILEFIVRDYYVPLYTILEFIVYMGWLKVAETLVNPMGEDDEDFDINAIINFNWS
ncbi:unnamed protein product, partial [Taenia asiatica]|uniref:Bestrophin homolog n=1 Tax=Taenia asiatica TaxID=60517 RepID=A0A0R3WFZ2_TAEAS